MSKYFFLFFFQFLGLNFCLSQLDTQKRLEKEKDKLEGDKKSIEWGSQIRNYILHPYKMVKDNRTNFESSSPEKVLDGEIDNFLESSLYKLNA